MKHKDMDERQNDTSKDEESTRIYQTITSAVRSSCDEHFAKQREARAALQSQEGRGK